MKISQVHDLVFGGNSLFAARRLSVTRMKHASLGHKFFFTPSINETHASEISLSFLIFIYCFKQHLGH